MTAPATDADLARVKELLVKINDGTPHGDYCSYWEFANKCDCGARSEMKFATDAVIGGVPAILARLTLADAVRGAALADAARARAEGLIEMRLLVEQLLHDRFHGCVGNVFEFRGDVRDEVRRLWPSGDEHLTEADLRGDGLTDAEKREIEASVFTAHYLDMRLCPTPVSRGGENVCGCDQARRTAAMDGRLR